MAPDGFRIPTTGTDAFWDGSFPNPMVGSLNNPTSTLSSIRPEASAAGAGHSLHSQDLGPVPVVPGGGVIPTLSIVTSTVSRSVNSSGSLNLLLLKPQDECWTKWR
jgi:hypothetical protein